MGKRKNKRSNCGRKPVQDKKIAVTAYVKMSTIEKLGGIEVARELSKNHINSLAGVQD